jgi:hypothetical protein
MLQHDDGGASNSPENPHMVELRPLAGTEVPIKGEGTTSHVTLVVAEKRWVGVKNWSWNVPVFSITVLQFDS